MVHIVKDNRVIHTSKNLRGIMDHARRVGVDEVVCIQGPQYAENTGDYRVQFSDGSHCWGQFASYQVMLEWFKARRWGAKIIIEIHG
jgi:sugar phosphate isomerase/epimerase